MPPSNDPTSGSQSSPPGHSPPSLMTRPLPPDDAFMRRHPLCNGPPRPGYHPKGRTTEQPERAVPGAARTALLTRAVLTSALRPPALRPASCALVGLRDSAAHRRGCSSVCGRGRVGAGLLCAEAGAGRAGGGWPSTEKRSLWGGLFVCRGGGFSAVALCG